MAKRQLLPFRHARHGDEGVPFIDYLDARTGRNRLVRQRQLAFIHEWDYLVDQLGRTPTPAEYRTAGERLDLRSTHCLMSLGSYSQVRIIRPPSARRSGTVSVHNSTKRRG